MKHFCDTVRWITVRAYFLILALVVFLFGRLLVFAHTPSGTIFSCIALLLVTLPLQLKLFSKFSRKTRAILAIELIVIVIGANRLMALAPSEASCEIKSLTLPGTISPPRRDLVNLLSETDFCELVYPLFWLNDPALSSVSLDKFGDSIFGMF